MAEPRCPDPACASDAVTRLSTDSGLEYRRVMWRCDTCLREFAIWEGEDAWAGKKT